MAENIEQDLKRTAEEFTGPPPGSITRAVLAPVARFWWIELLLGVFWLIVAAVVLKFNHASVATVGVLTGIMFLIFAAEEFALAILDRSAGKWLWAFFGVHVADTRGTSVDVLDVGHGHRAITPVDVPAHDIGRRAEVQHVGRSLDARR